MQQKVESDATIYASKDYPRIAKRIAELENIVQLINTIADLKEQLLQSQELSKGNDELAELAALECSDLETRIAENEHSLQELPIAKDPNDDKDCIIEIRAGAGR